MSEMFPDPRIDRVLYTSEDIQAAVRRIGAEVTADYADRALTLVTVLKGGTMFLADLCRAIELPLTVDFMAISAYGPDAEGSVRITKDLDDPIEGRDVLVVEDIIDTGLTLAYLLRVLRQRRPASVSVCTLLDKDARRLADLPIEYRGFSVPDRFLVGYGLDLDGLWRTLPYVATLHDEIWEAE